MNIAPQTVADTASRRRLIELLQNRRDIAARLVFEMTEYGVIQVPAISLTFATEVRQLGAQFAIDHFNLHRDSLRQPHRLLPHYTKLTSAYTNELAQNQDSGFIVLSLIRITQQLAIGVIAQAVESELTILRFEEMGFAGCQGYAGGRPEPIVESGLTAFAPPSAVFRDRRERRDSVACRMRHIVNELKPLGCRFTLDGFGRLAVGFDHHQDPLPRRLLLWPVASIVLQHQERLEGSGYPQSLTGDEDFHGARIIMVADVVEARTSDGPYHPRVEIDVALKEIEGRRGAAYDPGVADACLRQFRERHHIIRE